ncbi:MAG TPA: hypothetical protein VGN44_20690 [Candidatus Angelobacter sp.]|jgi:hypothetical protein
MSKLEEQQSAMRERMKAQSKPKIQPKSKMKKNSALSISHKPIAAVQQSSDVAKFSQQIEALKSENARLQAENEQLRSQKTVYVEREKSHAESRREQQHNYFKYSNARRW